MNDISFKKYENNKFIFIDVDDTLITPPYRSVKNVSKIFRLKNFPSKDEMFNRSDIEFYKSFPNVFKNKNHMWALALLSIPFGLFKSHELYSDLDLENLKQVLKQDNVFLISKNPPIFTYWRVKRLKELFGVNFEGRYLACGPIFKKSTSKMSIIKAIADLCEKKLSDCILIDDNLEEVSKANEIGIKSFLLDVSWNKGTENKFTKIARNEISKIISNNTEEVVIAEYKKKKPIIEIDFSIGIIKYLLNKFKAKLLNRNSLEIFTPKALSPFIKGANFSVIEKIMKTESGYIQINVSGLFKLMVPKYYFSKHISADLTDIKNYYVFKNRIFSFFTSLGFKFNRIFQNMTNFDKIDLVEKISQKFDLEKRHIAISYCNEIISSCHTLGCFIGYKYQSLLCKILFRNINYNIPYDLRKLEEKYFVVYVPTHRSFFDSSLMVKVIAENADVVPKFPAALKMKKNLVGMPGRFAGVFYIRREKIDHTYTQVLDSLIENFMKTSTSIVLFAEGKRSRTGLTLNSKNGIIKSIYKNRSALKEQKLCIVPISFTYNILPESELMEIETYKEYQSLGVNEPIFDVNLKLVKTKKLIFKTFKSILKSRSISDVYINFGSPTFIENSSTFLDTKDIMKNIFHEIQQVSPVVLTSLICLILSASKDNCAYLGSLKEQVNFFQFIVMTQKNESESLSKNLSEEFNKSLRELPFINIIEDKGDINKNIIYIDKTNIIKASKYRNNILHHFALASVLAKAVFVNKSGKIEDLIANLESVYLEIGKIFLIPTEKHNIIKYLKVLALFGIVTIEDDRFAFNPDINNDGFKNLTNISGIVEAFLTKKINFGFQRKFDRHKTTLKSKLYDNSMKEIDQVILSNISQTGGYIKTLENVDLDQDLILSVEDTNITVNIKVRIVKNDGFVFDFVISNFQTIFKVKSIFHSILSKQWNIEEKKYSVEKYNNNNEDIKKLA